MTELPNDVRWPFAYRDSLSIADERTVLTERLAARIGIDRHSSSSPGISLAVV